MADKRERQSNIELLRILSIMGIIVLHYNNPVIGKGIVYAKEGSINFYILYVLESLYACGVDLFILISGYFLCESKRRNVWKPIELIVQVILFKEGIYLFRALSHTVSFSLKTVVMNLVPSNYFVVLYCVVFIFSPFINCLFDHLSEKSLKFLTIISILIFSAYPTLVDVLGEIKGSEFVGLSSIGMYGSQWGYSIVNFSLMYLIGGYLKRGESRIGSWSIKKLTAGLIFCMIVLTVWARLNDKVGFFTERSAWEYCNPIIIAEAVFAFLLFTKFRLGTNKIVNKISGGGVFGFFASQYFYPLSEH